MKRRLAFGSAVPALLFLLVTVFRTQDSVFPGETESGDRASPQPSERIKERAAGGSLHLTAPAEPLRTPPPDTGDNPQPGALDEEHPDKNQVFARLVVVDQEDRKPLAGTTVSISRYDGEMHSEASTNPNGLAQFSLEPGGYRVHFRHPDYLPYGTGLDLVSPLFHVSHTIALTRASQVEGRVRNQFGRPVAEAEVHFNFLSRNQGRRAKTGSDGAFSVQLPPGRYQLWVRKPPHPPTSSEWITVPEIEWLELTLTETQVHRLHGQVRDEEGRPLSATVGVLFRSGASSIVQDSVRTTEEGFFELPLSATSPVEVRAQATGFEPQTRTADPERGEVLDFILQRYRTFRVTVYDPRGEVVPGAGVNGHSLANPSESVFRSGAERGTYYSSEFPVLLRAYAPRGGGISRPVIMDSYQEEITIQIEEGGHLRLNVRDTQGEPVRYFIPRLEGPAGFQYADKVSSLDGGFRLENLPPGPYRLRVMSPYFRESSQSFEITHGATSFIQVELSHLSQGAAPVR